MNIPKLTGIVIILAGIVLGMSVLNRSVYSAPNDGLVPDTSAEANVISATTTQTISAPAGSDIKKIVSSKPQAPVTQLPENPLPSRLSIPSLSIDAHVQQVTVNAKGNMGTPNNFTDVAWYKLGTVPGDPGSAVMDGHVDNGLALAGVFKHLEDIKVGDDVYVTRLDGKKLHFQVTHVTAYSLTDAEANKTVFEKTDAAHLNLITCSGDWLPDQKTYNKRLVVFTKLVG